jgi:hypothetical protein
MTKHGDFCLSPENLMLALLALLLAVPAFFAWGWFAPPMPGVEALIFYAIIALAFAYPAKIVLKHVGEAGTLWTRVAGCLTSAMIALGDLAIAWGVANGLRHQVLNPEGIALLALVIASLPIHLFQVADFLPEDEEERGKRVER